MSFYVLYVIVCAYYTPIVGFFCPRSIQTFSGESPPDGAEDEEATWRNLSENPNSSLNELVAASTQHYQEEDLASSSAGSPSCVGGGRASDSRKLKRGVSASQAVLGAVAPKTGMRLNTDLTITEESVNSYGCYVWKRSKFYSKMRVSSQKWQLRWITIDRQGFRSCRDKNHPDKHVRQFNIYQGTKVEVLDDTRLIFKLFTPTGNLQFQAPSQKIFHDVMRHIQAKIEIFSVRPAMERVVDGLRPSVSHPPTLCLPPRSCSHPHLRSPSLSISPTRTCRTTSALICTTRGPSPTEAN